jgi:hypothetical protein
MRAAVLAGNGMEHLARLARTSPAVVAGTLSQM